MLVLKIYHGIHNHHSYVYTLLYNIDVVADAKFWVGRGDKPSPQGIRIPDENGKEAPLRKYDKKTIVLTLPGVRIELQPS